MANVQTNEIVFTSTAFGPDDFLVRNYVGVEAISAPYEYEIELECRIDGVLGFDGVDELVDSSCHLGFGPNGMFGAHGFVRRVELVELALDATHAIYRVLLVPRMWQLKLVRRSRVFNEMSIPDIIRAVLADVQLAEGDDFELRLHGDYPQREYVVQYEETDFDFLSRWMERLGIFYFFEQEDRDKLVIIDRNEETIVVEEHGTCAYGHHGQVASPGAVHRLQMVQQVIPTEVRVRDYNWRTPQSFITGKSDIDPDHGRGMVGHYGDHVKDTGEANAMATARAEEHLASRVIFHGDSANYDFAPGLRYTLMGSPVGDYDQEYVITQVVHRGAQDLLAAGGGSYANSFEALPYLTAYRPPRRIPWPRLEGVMHAKIDSEQSSTASPIDEHGRYRVVLPFDMFGSFGGKATRWIRKAEPYTGPEYGMHFPLHPGIEVLIAHVDGDPDRPVIVGAVPNPMTATVVDGKLPTRSGIRTHAGIFFDFDDDAQA